jgi:hypothetical protein
MWHGALAYASYSSEKAQGMFGTLVIALPAEHSGGDVEATFRGKTKVLKTAPTSSFDFSYLAWFVLLTSLSRTIVYANMYEVFGCRACRY